MRTPRISLRAAACLLAAGWSLSAHAQDAAVPLEVTQVAPGVYVHAGRQEDWLPANGGDVANLGFIVGSRCVAVIDSGGSPGIGRRLRASVARATRLPVCYVINTHAHPDHLLGNAAFAVPAAEGAAPVFVASARLPGALAARERYYLNALQRDFALPMQPADIVYPGLTVDKTAELDLGERRLRLQAWRTAHTDNDLSVLDTQTRTLFLGDLLFAGHLPVLDGSLRGWLAVLNDLRSLDVALAVPGHGAPSTAWPGALDAQQRYLDELLRETRAAIKSRITIRQAVDASKLEAREGWLLVDRFHKRNVTAAYAELEWEE